MTLVPAAADAVRIVFPSGLYEVEAIKRAAYRCSNRLVVEIIPSDAEIVCLLRVKSPKDARELEAAFRTEVIDQDLRIRIGRETEPLRNLILSVAFSKTGLQE